MSQPPEMSQAAERPQISLVIAARNMAPFLGATLDSALNAHGPSREIIVVDDGSTDETLKIAAQYAARDQRVRVLERQGGEGVSVARNAGLELARADAILFLDADDLLTTDALERLSSALTTNPDATAAFDDLILMSEDGVDLSDRASRIDIKPRKDTLAALVAKNMIVNGGTLLIRKSAIDKVGAFTPGIAYGEDWEFWCRLATLGDFAVVDGAPVLRWRQRAQGANNLKRANPFDKSIAALDHVVNNPDIQARLGPAQLKKLARQRRIDLYWAGARQELMFGSKLRFLGYAMRGAVQYPDSLLRPKLILRFLSGLLSITRAKSSGTRNGAAP